VFLDIDGVLNTAGWMGVPQSLSLQDCPPEFRKWRQRQYSHIDPKAVQTLNGLVRPEIGFVLSSSWRIGYRWPHHDMHVQDYPYTKLQEVLEARGFTGKLLDRTPVGRELPGTHDYTTHQRGHEIAAWLDGNALGIKPDAFAILDDSDDMVHLSDRLVQTSWVGGLKEEHITKVLDLLSLTK